MPDLGTYAGPVLWSYAAALSLLALLVVLTIWQGRKARRALSEVERKRDADA